MQKFLRETDGLAQPVHDERLQLRAGRGAGPGEAETVDPVSQHVAQEGGVGVQGGEVGVHKSMHFQY